LRNFLIFTLALASIAGCAKNPIHPGAANQFDSNAYDVVLLYHDSIDSTKADLTAGTLPDAVKPVFNKFIDAYNVLDAAYKAYHAAAIGGTATADQLNALTQAEATAAASFADLIKIYPKAGTAKK
jgi:hypothetical protein